jgi:hypothetical protein
MPTSTASADSFSAIIHAWMAELAPKVQPMFADIEQWERDTLIRRYCILSADLRDTSIRLVDGFTQPPANADLTWWRNNVASPADSWCLRLWTDKEMLPCVLEETEDSFAVHVLIGLLIGFFFVSSELDRRLEAQQVSRQARRMFDDAIVNPPEVQTKAFQTLCSLIYEKTNKKQAEESHALMGLFDFLERERTTRAMNSKEYSALGAGPLQTNYPAKVESWDAVAGQLLVEDIERMERQYRPLLSTDLDIKALGSARDAERERYRKSLAKERGGPGTVDGKIAWQCCSQTMQRTVAHCPTCNRQRPDPVFHVSIDSEEAQVDDATVGIYDTIADQNRPNPLDVVLAHEEDAITRERLNNVEARLPSNVLSAFQLIAAGATDAEAANAVEISKKTIQRWRNKLRATN